MTEPALSVLHTKLASIRADIGTIEKTGEMTEGPKYSFVEAQVVGRKFVEAASAKGLTLVPINMTILQHFPTPSGKQTVVTIGVEWLLTDAETGESIAVYSIGQGADNSDKAAPKAQTNALKYAILLLLNAAGDDPERDGPSQKIENDHAAQAQARTAARRAAQAPTPPGAPAPAAAPAVPAEDPAAAAERASHVAMATDALKRKIRATAREKGLNDDQLKAFALTITGKASSKEWSQADGDKVLAKLDNAALVETFREMQPVAQA